MSGGPYLSSGLNITGLGGQHAILHNERYDELFPANMNCINTGRGCCWNAKYGVMICDTGRLAECEHQQLGMLMVLVVVVVGLVDGRQVRRPQSVSATLPGHTSQAAAGTDLGSQPSANS